VLRSTIPKLELDEAFASKDEIAAAVFHQLQSTMREFGYEIKNTLVTDMSPDARVKASMNEINASKYDRARDNSGIYRACPQTSHTGGGLPFRMSPCCSQATQGSGSSQS
jgi:regulator of protease activity HflC (stomatin/prohibitin superfamily)